MYEDEIMEQADHDIPEELHELYRESLESYPDRIKKAVVEGFKTDDEIVEAIQSAIDWNLSPVRGCVYP